MKAPRAVAAMLACLVAMTVVKAATAPSATAFPTDARGYVVIDAGSGETLDSYRPARRLSIASTTKLMTAYVALKELSLNETVRASSYIGSPEESMLRLRPGQRVSVRDLLYGLILRSGNDAAYDLALAASGSEAAFVREMNRYAAALGLADTHFANPIGLDEAGNYSTARDLAALTRRLLRIPVFARIAASRHAVLRSLRQPRRITSTNDLLFMVPWATGVKTGHTFGAGYVLVASGRRMGVELISALIGAETDEERYDDTLTLLDFVFSFYDKRTVVYDDEVLAEPSIRYSGDELLLRAAHAVVLGVRTGQSVDVAVRAREEVEGPLRMGAVLGRAIVSIDGRRVASVPLRAGEAVPEASAWDRTRSFLADNWGWLALGLLGILVVVALLRRRSR